jgi:His-Xaa-Ser system protein HxsD
MRIYFDKEIYSRDALVKAAYTFIDDLYVYLSQDEENYIVDISVKDVAKQISNIEDKFKNEMLLQCARQIVYSDTKDIRKMILARAMASTIIENKPKVYSSNKINSEPDEILNDWFDKNDK